MRRFSKFAAALAVVPMLAFAAPVLADSPGQIEGGAIYAIKDVTQNGTFSNSATANACDELRYSARIHNSGYDGLSSIVVSVTLPATSSTTNTSNLTATSPDAVPTTTTASATVNLSSAQTVSYVSGSTQLLDANGNVIENLPDGITTTNGVNIGSLNGSTMEYVDFTAKVGCPTPPATPTTTVKTVSAPTQLVNTGPGNVIGLFAAVTVAGAIAHRLYSRRFARHSK